MVTLFIILLSAVIVATVVNSIIIGRYLARQKRVDNVISRIQALDKSVADENREVTEHSKELRQGRDARKASRVREDSAAEQLAKN